MSVKFLLRGLALAVLVVLPVALSVGFAAFLYRLPNPEPKTFEEKAAALVVFTGAQRRIPIALQLLSQNHAPTLFVSGVHHKALLKDITRQVQGLSKADRVVLGHNAKNTFQNAIETKNWTQKNSILTIILVTSQDHMPRSRLYLRTLAPDLKVISYPVQTKSEHRVAQMREYVKFLLTYPHIWGLALHSAIFTEG